MEESDEKDKGFKVQDKRRFSAEGELKPEHRGQDEARAERGGEAPRPDSSAKPATSASTAAAAAEHSHEDIGPSEINFATFIVGLSTQALLHLGEIPDPTTNNPVRDLTAAQQLIDILGLLRDKTRGNLDRDEAGLLDSILFDLRMKYVEITRNPSR
ncbi:MAG TPA: DUF1844 domain-containing protein [Candidatus Binataceae bacterium]|nr:DUF1844 domain-containing protein [Candidatus Binataceae bacterium]